MTLRIRAQFDVRRRGCQRNGTHVERANNYRAVRGIAVLERRGRKMDSLGNRFSRFTPRRAYYARGGVAPIPFPSANQPPPS